MLNIPNHVEFCIDVFNRAVNGGACGQTFIIKTQPLDGTRGKYEHHKLTCKGQLEWFVVI